MTVLVVRRQVACQKAAATARVDVEVGMRELDPRVDDPGRGERARDTAAHARDAPWLFLRGLRRAAAAGRGRRADRRRGDDLVLFTIGDLGIGRLQPTDRLRRNVDVKTLDRGLVRAPQLPAARLDRTVRLRLRTAAGHRTLLEHADIAARDPASARNNDAVC